MFIKVSVQLQSDIIFCNSTYIKTGHTVYIYTKIHMAARFSTKESQGPVEKSSEGPFKMDFNIVVTSIG